MDDATIFALSSGAPPAGVAVIRITGPHVRFVLETMLGYIPEPRYATLSSLAFMGENLDQALVLFFPGPASFTGEDVCEFHIHGGSAVVKAVLSVLGSMDGLRMAEAGEFTWRAFMHGKMDLTAVEGLSDLLQAETEMQRRQARDMAFGRLNQAAEIWREDLVRARSLIEAELDFADEEDVPESLQSEVVAAILALRKKLNETLKNFHAGERLRSGFEIILLGAPNVGKSSLLNAVARRDVAIVSSEAGTTRDLVEVHLDLGGYAVRLVDTAGLRDVEGGVEGEGIRRARERAGLADLVLLLDNLDSNTEQSLKTDDYKAVWRIGTKADLIDSDPQQLVKYDYIISSISGSGLSELLESLERFVSETTQGYSPLINRERHYRLLKQAVESLDRSLQHHISLELMAEDLRVVSDCLARLVGRIDVEDLLSSIFAEFCVGK